MQELDQRLFNKAVDFGHTLLDNGYAKTWFTWIEWVSLSAFILVAGIKLNSLLMKIIAGISFLIVFFVGLAAIEGFTMSKIQYFKGNPAKIILFALCLNLTGLLVVFHVVWSILRISNL